MGFGFAMIEYVVLNIERDDFGMGCRVQSWGVLGQNDSGIESGTYGESL